MASYKLLYQLDHLIDFATSFLERFLDRFPDRFPGGYFIPTVDFYLYLRGVPGGVLDGNFGFIPGGLSEGLGGCIMGDCELTQWNGRECGLFHGASIVSTCGLIVSSWMPCWKIV